MYKCLQSIGGDGEKVDSSLIQTILIPFLSPTDSESAILAKMSLANLCSHQLDITLEDVDIESLQKMVRSEETAAEVLNFLESIVTCGTCIATVRSSAGMELISTVMEWCEGSEDLQGRAAVLIELLLSN